MSTDHDPPSTLARRLAKGVSARAQAGGMPDSYWHTDRHIKQACEVLGWSPEQARDADMEDLDPEVTDGD